MKKIMKRLLTGVLSLATVFTALPASQVQAAEKQYWTDAQEKAGYVEKVMNDGSIGSTFHESRWFVLAVLGRLAATTIRPPVSNRRHKYNRKQSKKLGKSL